MQPNGKNVIEEVFTYKIQASRKRFSGIVHIGELSDNFVVNGVKNSFKLRIGFESIRTVQTIDGIADVHNKIILEHGQIKYLCYTDILGVSDTKISSAVKKLFKALNVAFKRKWSAYEFFGFMKSNVLELLSVSN